MTLVQNLQQLLSGNKSLLILVFTAFVFQSCGIFGKGRRTPPPPPPPIEDNKDSESEDKDTVVITPPDVIEIDTIKKDDPIVVKDVVNIAVVLPFHLDNLQQTGQFNNASTFSFEIYKGIRYAIDEVLFEDEIVNLYVFDNEGLEDKTKQILMQEPFPEVDAVIGPLFAKNIRMVSDFALEHKIPFISPLSSTPSIASNNPYIYSANPTKQTRYEALFDYIQDEFSKPNVSIIHQPLPKEIKTKDELLAIAAKTKQDVMVKESEGRTMFSVSSEVLEKDRDNVIILPVKDNEEGEIYLDRMLMYLETMASRYEIKVIGIEEWNSIAAIAPEKYPNVDFYVIDRFFMDNRPRKVQEYNRLLKLNNSVMLDDYAIQGYDLMSYFVALIHKYGKNFEQHLDRDYDGLQTDFVFDNFKYNGGNQFKENKTVNILQYQGGEWKKVN